MIVAILVAGLLLHGCLVDDDSLVLEQSYSAVFGVPNGVERQVFGWTFFGPGSYCIPTTDVSLSGQLTQGSPPPPQVVLRWSRFEDTEFITVFEATVNVEENGNIPLQVFPFQAYCHEFLKLHILSVQPMGGNIDENAQLRTLLRIGRVP